MSVSQNTTKTKIRNCVLSFFENSASVGDIFQSGDCLYNPIRCFCGRCSIWMSLETTQSPQGIIEWTPFKFFNWVSHRLRRHRVDREHRVIVTTTEIDEKHLGCSVSFVSRFARERWFRGINNDWFKQLLTKMLPFVLNLHKLYLHLSHSK